MIDDLLQAQKGGGGPALAPAFNQRRRQEELPREQKIIPFCKISLRGCEAQTLLLWAACKNLQFMDGGIEA
jgi:hypothetical protein